jgi:hypothetical protein
MWLQSQLDDSSLAGQQGDAHNGHVDTTQIATKLENGR